MKAIEAKGVSKRYYICPGREPTFKGMMMDWLRNRQAFTAFSALDEVSFFVDRGETVGIIGENGSGKSTLLSVAAGILKPTSGTICVEGKVASLLELGAGFHGDLSGRENIYLNGSILGFSRRQMDERYKDIVEFSELGDFIETPVKYYSSGMYVRLGFSIAVEVEPDILLIDEVLTVGDEHFQQKCFRRIKDFQSSGKTMLFVSHALGLVEELCDRVLLLHRGKVRACGEPRDTLEIYQKMIQEKNELVAPKEWGSREAQITGVRFLDGKGQEIQFLLAGEPLRIEISYNAPKAVYEPVFGIAVHSRDGQNLFGTNTQLCGYRIDCINGSGVIEVEIERLSLFKGSFFFNFSLHSNDHKIQYHRLDFFHQLEVDNLRPEVGYLQLQTRWKMVSK